VTQRISHIAPPGFLLKSGAPKRKPKAKREREVDYLALVRRCPCIACDNDPAGEAAHVRLSAPGKPITGTGIKPDDCWSLPLCTQCHTRGKDAQHRVGELPFWRALGLDPLVICERLHAARSSIETMRAVIFKARETRKG
jgi:hypothetical protein